MAAARTTLPVRDEQDDRAHHDDRAHRDDRAHHDDRAHRDDSVDLLLAELTSARESGDAAAIRAAESAVVIAFLPVAARIAGRYRNRGVDRDDLVQIARVGLVGAVQRWRPQPSKTSFLTFAVPTIDGEVKRYFRDHAATIRLPRSVYENQVKVSAATARLHGRLRREPTFTEIAAASGTPVETIRGTLRAARRRTLSLDAESDESVRILDTLPCSVAARDMDRVAQRAALRTGIAALTERQRRIIALRFVYGRTQQHIADDLGVSQMHVSRLLAGALATLRECVALM